MTTSKEREKVLAVRTSDEVKAKLRELAELIGKAYGTKVTQTQALEIAITEAVSKYKT